MSAELAAPRSGRLRPVPSPLAPPAPLAVDPDQQRALDARASAPVLALGGPGTGKTSLLVEGVARQVAAGSELARQLVLAPNRRLAQDLRSRIVRRVGGAHLQPRALTGHGLAQAIVTRHLPDTTLGPPALLTAPEQEFRIREILAHLDTSGWPRDLALAATTRAFASEVRTACARVRQLGLDPDDVAELGRRAGRPEWVCFADFFATYLDVLDAEHVLDYAEVVHRARLLLLDDEVSSAVAGAIDTLWCDDLGEFDPSQVQLLADLVSRGVGLFATGDPLTSVFGFRGADERVLTDFPRIFEGGTVVPQTRQHRMAPQVAEAVGRAAQRLPRPASFVPAEPPEGRLGEVRVLVCDSPGAQAEHIAQQLRAAHLHGGIPWHDMAVITRSSRGLLALLGRTLTGHDVPVHLAADDIALAEAPAVRPLLNGLSAAVVIAEGGRPPADLVMDLLRSPLCGLDAVALRGLGRHLRAQARELRQEALSSAEWTALLVAEPDAFEHLEPTPASERARALGVLLRDAARLITEDASASVVLWALWNRTPWPGRLRQAVLSEDDSAVTADRDLDAVSALFDLAARDTSLVGVRSARALLQEVSSQQIAADHARENLQARRGVQLLTAHRAKGESFRLVVVAGLQESDWPSHRRAGTILAAAELGESDVTPPEPFAARIGSERRLFQLAASRATEQLVVTCSRGTDGEADQPSRFLAELGVEVTEVTGRPRRPLTFAAMTAELRRAAMSSSLPVRTAAAARLARLSAMVDAQGRPVAPAADPGRWWSMLDYSRSEVPVVPDDQPVVLRGSEVEQVLTCPRQWFLSRQASAEAGRGSASSLGSVIHVLVDHASAEDTPLDDLREHLDHVWNQIPFDAEWLSASERAEADAALERYALWDAANRRTVVGTEVVFELEVDTTAGPVRLRGTVDRLEQDTDGRLVIVDFKTGRTPPTVAEAERLPQLGVYQYAATLGAFRHLAPEATGVAGAELVYLRKDAGGLPKVLVQPSLDAQPWPDEPTEGETEPHWAAAALRDAALTVRRDDFPAREGRACQWCPFLLSCPAKQPTELVT